MHGEVAVPLRALICFLLILFRIVGLFVYLPLPGKDAGPSMARVVFAFAVALAITPSAAWKEGPEPTLPLLLLWATSELALGLTIGLIVGFLAEALTVGAHILALQAGYAYASVIDPTTQADSDVLQVLAQLLGGLLFFGFRLDLLAVRTIIYSLKTFPPGQFAVSPGLARSVVALSAELFAIALELALPAVAFLLITELALAIVGRLSAQLHLGANAASIKMMLGLLLLSGLLRVIPQLYQGYASQLFAFLKMLVWRTAA